MKFLLWFTKKALSGIVPGMFFVLTVASVTYALTYNWSDPSGIRSRTAGNPLTASGWNLLVGNVDNLNERLGNITGNISSTTPSVANSGFYQGTKPLGRFRFCALTEIYQANAAYRTYAHVYPDAGYGDGTYEWTLATDGTYAMTSCF